MSLFQSLAQAVGVVGIVQCDFLEPIHNKQDFNKTDRYKLVLFLCGIKLNLRQKQGICPNYNYFCYP